MQPPVKTGHPQDIEDLRADVPKDKVPGHHLMRRDELAKPRRGNILKLSKVKDQ